MPKKFCETDKYCKICNNKLILNNTRDITKKKYCSKRCVGLSLLNPMAEKYHSEETKQKMRKRKEGIFDGNKNPNYKDGKYTGRHENRKEWQRLSKRIRQRDSHECCCCLSKERLDVHHIIPYNITKDDSSENLLTLCRSCHTFADNLGRR